MIQYIIEQIEDKYDTYLSEDEIALIAETLDVIEEFSSISGGVSKKAIRRGRAKAANRLKRENKLEEIKKSHFYQQRGQNNALTKLLKEKDDEIIKLNKEVEKLNKDLDGYGVMEVKALRSALAEAEKKAAKPSIEYSKNWLIRNLIQRPSMEAPISTALLSTGGVLGGNYLIDKYTKNNDQNTDTRNPKNSKI